MKNTETAFKMAMKEKALLADDEESHTTETEVQGVTKDSWQAFLTCFALLLSRAFINGVLHSWGFFLVAFVKDMKSSTESAGNVTRGHGMKKNERRVTRLSHRRGLNPGGGGLTLYF